MKPRTFRPVALALIIAFAVFGTAGTAAPNHSGSRRAIGNAAGQSAHPALRLDSQLRAKVADHAHEQQRVIIRVRPGKRPALKQSLTAHGDRIVVEHDSLDALTAIVHGDDLAELGESDDILSVSADAIVSPDSLLGGLLGLVTNTVNAVVDVVGSVLLPNGADTSGPAVPPAVLRETLGLANTSLTGRGVGVAVIDSGLEMSDEFKGRVKAFYDFTGGGIVAKTPYDDYGHGTHVAGTIGGSGALSRNAAYRGLAPSVKLIVLKVLDKNGAGYTSDVIRAVDFAVANRSAFGIDIINLSLGHPILEPAATDPLVQAVERASRAGIIVIAAAGNMGKNPTTGLPGYAGITSPGNAPSAITAGAVRTEDTVSRSDDRLPDYSSSGPTWYDAFLKPDVVSPGHNIVAVAAKRGTLYKTYPQLQADDSDYMRLSGTSMATAVTTGSVALLLQANRDANQSYYEPHPPLTPNAVKALLQYTAIGVHNDAGVEYDPLRKGAGALNAKGAIELGEDVDTSTPQGRYWLIAAHNPWTVIAGESLTWNQAIIWGTQILWGSTASVNEQAWGSAIIWGTNDVAWSSAIIWGTNVVWTDPQSWSSAIIWGTDTVGYSDGSAIIWGTSGGMTAENIAWKDVGSTATSQGATTGQ